MAGVRDRREGRVGRRERGQRQRRQGRLAAAEDAAAAVERVAVVGGFAVDSLPGCWQHLMLRTVGILEDLLADQRRLQVPMGDDLPFRGDGAGCGKWPDVLQ